MGLIAGILGTIAGLGQDGVYTADEPGDASMLDHAHQAAGALPQGDAALLLVLAFTMLGTLLCGLFGALRVKSKLPAFATVALLAASFVVVLMAYLNNHESARIAFGFDWINFKVGMAHGVPQYFAANFSLYIDPLTLLWMLFVTGLGAAIALYASEYMAADVGAGYCRFFAAFNLFVFSMSCLVMADNLLLLYLGWEGVGLCSYLLIGYFYKRPAAVAAAKKAFIMNRIGDLGLALGVMSIYVAFGTVQFEPLFRMVHAGVDAAGQPIAGTWIVKLIPFLFTCGAFGKSAQLFFYVWLPDAMEGPTPVSALIHAATMVTAGVFLIARMYPLYLADPAHTVLHVVAWGGAITAFWAATIGMAHFDIKRIMGYSTVSQLGYMFAGLGVSSSIGAASHVFTHAFFKATLFLACGAVMHGFAGQLDLRKLSGVRKMQGWGVVGLAMLVGSLNLAGFPGLAGFWSKDTILAESFANQLAPVGWLLLLTAGLTAYYTFRAYFRVFEGPIEYHPGEELHGQEGEGEGEHGVGPTGHVGEGEHKDDPHGHDAHAAGHFHPHAPGWAINLVLVLLSLGCFAIIPLAFVGHEGWAGEMVRHSTAAYEPSEHAEHGTFLGMNPHTAMYAVSTAVGLIGIAAAWWLHLAGRREAATARADALVPALGPIVKWARAKWYVDEIYDYLVVTPLWVLAHVLHQVDQWIVDGLVNVAGWTPGAVGKSVRPSQSGELHGYALGMAGGIAVLLLIVLFAVM